MSRKAFYLACTGFLILAFSGTGHAAPFPDTGEVKCYENCMEIPCPSPGELFYGQDDQYPRLFGRIPSLDMVASNCPISPSRHECGS